MNSVKLLVCLAGTLQVIHAQPPEFDRYEIRDMASKERVLLADFNADGKLDLVQFTTIDFIPYQQGRSILSVRLGLGDGRVQDALEPERVSGFPCQIRRA